MDIYLPIAETTVNLLLIVTLGAGIGFLAGLVGVGGGFLATPLLIFLGIPPAVAAASEANHILASSVSGAIAHSRRRAIDVRMALVLTAGGLAGSTLGVQLFVALLKIGQIDFVISLLYVVLLGGVGSLMLRESLAAMRLRRDGLAPPPPRARRSLAQKLPLRMRFAASRLYISVLPPLVIGFGVGVLAAILGVGGGFLLVPAMIYVLRMPTNVVIGTSLLQIIFVTGYTVLLQAWRTQTVDIILAGLLIIGGVVGAQIGARMGGRMPSEHLRAILGAIVLAVAAVMAWGLLGPRSELFSVTTTP